METMSRHRNFIAVLTEHLKREGYLVERALAVNPAGRRKRTARKRLTDPSEPAEGGPRSTHKTA